jgi:hypothetical protein
MVMKEMDRDKNNSLIHVEVSEGDLYWVSATAIFSLGSNSCLMGDNSKLSGIPRLRLCEPR